MNYYALWGSPVTQPVVSGRSYYTLVLIIGIILGATIATIYFAVIRPYNKNKKKADEIELLEELLSQGKITEAEFKAKRREILGRK